MDQSTPSTENGDLQNKTPLDMDGNPQFNKDTASVYQLRMHEVNGSVIRYLQSRASNFRLLSELRQKGWNNPAGDEYFKRQRNNADTASKTVSKGFYAMMQRIGEELNTATNAFKVLVLPSTSRRILDLCVAPGGFLCTALQHNQNATALGFSLPFSDGGHNVLLRPSRAVVIRYHDITMFAGDMGVTELPAAQLDHPDADKFHLEPQLNQNATYDIAICDGQVLRTQQRASYREKREATRLIVVQLAMGLEHLRPGGNMIVLLHKAEQWNTIRLLHTFSKFSCVQMYKPTRQHTLRSSFYMIATNVQSHSQAAVLAIQKWKDTWKAATFDTEEEYEDFVLDGITDAEDVLEEFGPQFLELATQVWDVQIAALEKAEFVK